MVRFQFNSSRLYTAEGQVIVVEYDEATGEAKFSDFSRMIDKVVRIEAGLGQKDRRRIAELVMNEYDHYRGEYIGSVEAPKRDFTEVVHLFRI